jgi:hypothetical protein
VFPRYVKTRFGVRELPSDEPQTPLLGLLLGFSVMERVGSSAHVYDRTEGWDESIGQRVEGVDLFIQMAFLSQGTPSAAPVHYRRHTGQASPVSDVSVGKIYGCRSMAWPRGPPAFRALIDDAQAFRAGRLRLYLSLAAAARYLRRAEVRHAGRCLLDGLKIASRIVRRGHTWPAETAS